MSGPRSWTGTSLVAFWLLSFTFYAVTGTGHSSSSDASLMFLTARNLLHRGELSVPPLPGTGHLRKTGVDGRPYLIFAPGLIVAHLPMLAVAQVARRLSLLTLPSGERPTSRSEDEFWVQFTNAWVTAWVVTLLVLFVSDLGGSRAEALRIALLVGLASPVWLYARADSYEALQALALLGACLFLRRTRLAAGAAGYSALAGAFCGANILVKTFNVILVPLFLAYLFSTVRERRLKALTAFLAPVAAAIVLSGLYNYIRFGSPLDSGYDPQVHRFSAPLVPGVLKLIFSPSYGLLLFWPSSVLALLGFSRHWRARPADTALWVGLFLAHLLLYARWWAFSGFGMGPRFLVPAIPFLALLTLPVVASARRAARVFTLVCFVGGAAVQTLAATTNHWQQYLYGVCGRAAVPEDGRCVDDLNIPFLRVAWWRLEGAWVRARTPERFAAYVEAAPWHEVYPWRNPETATQEQWENTGLDMWAAPDRWRLHRYYLWLPGRKAFIPSSVPLAILLVVVGTGSLLVLLRAKTK